MRHPSRCRLEDAENVAAGARIVSSAATVTGIEETQVRVEVIDGDLFHRMRIDVTSIEAIQATANDMRSPYSL